MTIKVGDKIPHATLRQVTPDGAVPVTTDDFFAGRKVVLFGLPGAFTPTCHKNHLPGYVSLADDIKAKGVDTIAVVAVNDPFVMGAWETASGANGKILFLADPAAEFAKSLDLTFDGSAAGLGLRSKRYSMLVEDGVVKILNVEDVPSKADISSAKALLAQL